MKNRKQRLGICSALLLSLTAAYAQEEQSVKSKSTAVEKSNAERTMHALGAFKIEHPNWKLSPETGMDRDEWIACGRHVLEGAFSYVKNLEDPMFLPKQPGPGYPRSNETASQQQRSAAIFEAVARSFNVAAPLIKNDPDIEINGIRLADYYKYHFLKIMTDRECDYFMGETSDYNSQIQQTCELGNLAMWSIISPESFWDLLSPEEKELIAQSFKDWSATHTLPHNWRWFNVMMLTFLDLNGYDADKELMINHLDNLLLHYAGDGWFRDTSYDYYTVHVFHLYGAIWASHYGREKFPRRAAVIDKQFDEFSNHYPQIFGRKGEVIMYGRSILYRLGASAGMGAVGLRGRKTDSISLGEARRVASGALLQFTSHSNFFHNGIPSLGFYGPFPACIQGYSCSASPFWMFLNFACLTLPADDPFWTAVEEPGFWSNLGPNDHNVEFWPGPGFLVCNHAANGSSEIHPGKIHNNNPNYSRLVYNSAFPWEANSSDNITAGAISLKRGKGRTALPAAVSLAGFRDGVFYRQAQFSGHLPPCIDMASISIPGGEIRVERARRMHPCEIYLGHFSMPHIGGEPIISKRNIEGHQCIELKIPGRRLAMTNYRGWDGLELRTRRNAHPEAEYSTLVYAALRDKTRFTPPSIMISVLLHKTDDADWSDDELQPIAKVEPLQKGGIMHLTGLRITLKNGKLYDVDYQNIDGTDSTW